jgi:MoaA/NifB/PqqE/SkfB family radical SAM enzyme
MLSKTTTLSMQRIKNRFKAYASFGIKNMNNPRFIVSSLKSEFPFIFPDPKTPPMLTLEISNRCNINCEYCFRRGDTRPEEFMPYDEVIRILDEAKKNRVSRLRFVGNGEPTIHPNIKEILEHASKSADVIDIKTNGMALTTEICNTLIKTVTRINISVEGYLPEHIEKGRVGVSYEKMINNLNRLNEIRNKTKSKSVIILNVMYRPSMADKRDEMLNFWKPYGDHILLHQLRSTGEIDKGKDLFEFKVSTDEQIRCNLPLKTMDIFFDGTISYCCYIPLDVSPEIRDLGNIKEMSIYEAWNHPRLVELRKGQRASDHSLTPHCIGCYGPKACQG